MKAETIADFETGFIAPIYGYEDNVDYYRMTSCGYFLTVIAVPTYVINSQDDPFIDPACFPLESTYMGGGNDPVLMKQLDHRGNSAYMFHQGGRRGGGRGEMMMMAITLTTTMTTLYRLGCQPSWLDS